MEPIIHKKSVNKNMNQMKKTISNLVSKFISFRDEINGKITCYMRLTYHKDGKNVKLIFIKNIKLSTLYHYQNLNQKQICL